MTDCAPVYIANGLKTAFDAAVVADTFSIPFDCRAGIVFDEKLPDLPGASNRVIRPLIDIVVPVSPQMELTGRYWYTHRVPITVGMRQQLNSNHFRDDESIDLDAIAPQLNLFYELISFMFPSNASPKGMRIDGVVIVPPPEIVFVYHPELLETAKQYCGIFRATLQLQEDGNA